MAARKTAVIVETGRRRSFASAAEWPGWCRSGRTEEAALEALADCRDRFAPVAARAGHPLPATATSFIVVERVVGDATTDFGAPGRLAEDDGRPLTGTEARRLVDLLEAVWSTFDEVVAAAPEALRKGPRGGGRDTSKVVEHVTKAEASYGRQIGVKAPPAELRAALAAVLAAPSDGAPLAGKRWPARYAIRRIAWHVLDHAWEIEDRAG